MPPKRDFSRLSQPVVALDIDGTLGDFHGHFLRFAQEWYGRPMPLAEENPGLPLHQFMKTSKEKYRRCKLAYRQGGMKRSMPVYPGASQLTQNIRKRGLQVWICTTRPYLQLSNIDPDTREWLRRNRIQYDGVLYGQHKYRDLAKEVGRENVLLVADDLPEMCTQAIGQGFTTVLRDQPYNQYFQDMGKFRVFDMQEIEHRVGYELGNWQRRKNAEIGIAGRARNSRGRRNYLQPVPGVVGQVRPEEHCIWRPA